MEQAQFAVLEIDWFIASLQPMRWIKSLAGVRAPAGGAHTLLPATPVNHCASAFFGQPISVSNDVLEVAETVSARRVLVIRARPFRYAVVTLVATAERRGPRRNTASIRCWVRRIIDVMVRLTEAGCELRYTLPQGLKLRSAVCASHPT